MDYVALLIEASKQADSHNHYKFIANAYELTFSLFGIGLSDNNRLLSMYCSIIILIKVNFLPSFVIIAVLEQIKRNNQK